MPTKVLITSPGRLTRGTKILVRQNGQFSEYVVRSNLVIHVRMFLMIGEHVFEDIHIFKSVLEDTLTKKIQKPEFAYALPL